MLVPRPTSSSNSFLVPPLWRLKKILSVQECIPALLEGISSAGSYFPNYQRRGPLCSIVGAMVSHVGHINTGEQASVTHSWVCSSPRAPARSMPMQTTLPIPHLNHTGFLQEPGAEIQFWKWRFWVVSIHMMGVECWEEHCQRDWLFFLSHSTPSE